MCGLPGPERPAALAPEAYGALLAHELRTPVTAILGYLQLLEDDALLDDPRRLRQYLAVVSGRASDLARIVSELTRLAELSEGRILSFPSAPATDLSSIVTELARGRPVKLEMSASASEASVETDRLRLVVEQLLENAFTYGRPGAAVLVRATLEEDPPRLVVRVTNRGRQIPSELREAIFEPFCQAENLTTRRHGGLGLGLTVARRAAEGAGGSLTLEPGSPTTFRLQLPLREDPISRELRQMRQEAAQADAQALRAIQDLRSLRTIAQRERSAREMAEAQQVLAAADVRVAHRQALDLAEQLDRAYMETTIALARAVEARDLYTGGHVERVRRYSLKVAEELGLDAREMRYLEFGAVLHDIGKVGIPDQILTKSSNLGADEWVVMQRHPEIGRRVLQGIAFLTPALDAVSCHHERWDGKGYPRGLAGTDIPLFGRIVSVADAYDAMTSDRPYRRALPIAVALEEIERGRGAQFDPDVAAAFLTRSHLQAE